ncbi:MAG: CBS domain-containing protein [Acidimicrobiales bacterium]
MKETIVVGFSYFLPEGLTDPVRSLAAFAVHEGSPSDSFALVAERLTSLGCSALPVRMPDGRLGIVTERDIVQAVALDTTDLTAAALASMPVIEIDADRSVDDAAELMMVSGVRHLVVRDDERLGIVSMRDVVEALLSASRT